MRHRLAGVLGVLVLFAAGCGDGPDVSELRVRDSGAGTGTLLVQAYVKGEATVPNAADPSEFRTRIVVRVARRGVPVGDATVRANALTLVHRGMGVYGEPTQLLGLPPPVVAVEASAGGDWVRAACSSPGVHAFVQPARGGDVLAWSAGAPLEIGWIRPSRADSASLNVGGFTAIGDIDDGAFAIPSNAPGLAPAAPAAVGLWRENQVLLAGGATGSLLSVSVWNGLQVTLQRN